MLTHKHELHLSLFVFAVLALGCGEDDCKADGDCARGQICQSNQCSSIPCNSPSDCPEGNRTCVYGFGSCGQKECNTGDPQLDVCQSALCESASSTCFIQCTADTDCAGAGNDMQCQSGLCKVDAVGSLATRLSPWRQGAIPGVAMALAALVATIRVRKLCPPACHVRQQWRCRMHNRETML